MLPELLKIALTTSSIFGLLAFLAVLYYAHRLGEARRSERSVREIVEGEGLFNADQVLKILRQFKDDTQRLEALKTFANISDQAARRIYGKIKNNVDLGQLDARNVQSRQKQALWVAAFFFAIALVALAFAILQRFPVPADGRPSPSPTPTAVITPVPSPSPTATAVITPVPNPSPTATAPTPNPSPTTLSWEQVRQMWMGIINRVRDSELVESYIPTRGQVDSKDLVNTINDNETLQKVIKHFESHVHDPTLQNRFIGIDQSFAILQHDLMKVDQKVWQYPDIFTASPYDKLALQTAEHGRVQLLRDLTGVTLTLQLPNPQFPNSKEIKIEDYQTAH